MIRLRRKLSLTFLARLAQGSLQTAWLRHVGVWLRSRFGRCGCLSCCFLAAGCASRCLHSYSFSWLGAAAHETGTWLDAAAHSSALDSPALTSCTFIANILLFCEERHRHVVGTHSSRHCAKVTDESAGSVPMCRRLRHTSLWRSLRRPAQLMVMVV